MTVTAAAYTPPRTMDVFQLRDTVIGDYHSYVTSFMALRDPRIVKRVNDALAEGRLWPEPRIGLNPAFAPGGSVDDLVAEGLLHETCRDTFRIESRDGSIIPLRFHCHQTDAVREARAGRNYVLTTGTGSGKSLSYIAPIVDRASRRLGRVDQGDRHVSDERPGQQPVQRAEQVPLGQAGSASPAIPGRRTTRPVMQSAKAIATSVPYETVLDPPPADPRVAHPESTRPEWAKPPVRRRD